jgi:hypothetical protein
MLIGLVAPGVQFLTLTLGVNSNACTDSKILRLEVSDLDDNVLFRSPVST